MKFMKKIIIYMMLSVIILILLFLGWKNYNINQKQVAVLVYHNIVENDKFKANNADTITTKEFIEQLKYLKDKGYTTISLDELYNWKKGKIDIPEKSVVITFDDAYYSFKYIAKPILQQYNFKAACFLIGNVTEYNTQAYEEGKYATIGLDEVNNRSETIIYGSHTFDLHRQAEDGTPIIKFKSYKEIKEDTKKFNTQLFEAKYLAYPYYTYTNEMIKVLEEENYKLAFAGEEEMMTKGVNNYKIPRISAVKSIDEFKKIFETPKYRNKYGNGLIRKICVKLERAIAK